MQRLLQIDKCYVEFYNNQWIIWKNHNKNFTQGSYYVLNDNGTIDFIVEKYNDVKIIRNINATNDV